MNQDIILLITMVVKELLLILLGNIMVLLLRCLKILYVWVKNWNVHK